jgi:hypothetical protein
MKPRLFPINDNAFSSAFAATFSWPAFAPTRQPTFGEAVDARGREPRLGFWDRIDRWAWKQVQKEREAYLAKAQNLAELESRMRDLDSVRGRFF